MISASTVAEIVGGVLHNLSGEELTDGSLFFDSRAPRKNGIFLALKGERVDGHDFAPNAGGAFALLERNLDCPAIIVPDVMQAAAKWASFYRSTLTDLTVIGITGSQGKTTTKDMIAHILKTSLSSRNRGTVAPIGSYNNDLGLPVTLTQCNESTGFCVAEMGARHLGDIYRLAQMARPSIGVVLKVGTAHLGEFGSREAIARAKSELVMGIQPGGVAILGTYDEFTPKMAESRSDLKVIRFGESGVEEIRATDVEMRSGFAHFELVTPHGREAVELGIAGAHHVANALAAAAVAFTLGLSDNEIATGLTTFKPESKWRMEMSEIAGVMIINDSYNANPESMAGALRTTALMAQERGGRSFAFLGTMHELGAQSDSLHREVGDFAAQLGIDYLVAIDEKRYLEGDHGDWLAAESRDSAKAFFSYVEPGDCVLFKASRAEGLELLASDFIEYLKSIESERGLA